MWLLLICVGVGAAAAASPLAGRRTRPAGSDHPARTDHPTHPAHPDRPTRRARPTRPSRPAHPDLTAGIPLPVLVPAGAGLALLAAGRAADGSAGVGLMCAGYAVLAVSAVAVGLAGRRGGFLLIAAGLAANLMVTAADGGMPVRGLPPGVPAAGHHHGLSERDDLAPLADVIRVAPLRETLSPGDAALAAGAGVAVFAWLGERPSRRRQGAARPAGRPLPVE